MRAPRPWLAPDSNPDATALIFKGRSVSRARLVAQADSLAHWLGELGIGTGDVVAALLPNGIPFVALLHAIDRRGAVLLPLNTRHTPRELAPALRETRTRVLLHGGGELGFTARTAGRLAGEINVSRIIPGHGGPAGREQLGVTMAYLSDLLGTVGSAIDEGKSLEQTLRDAPTPTQVAQAPEALRPFLEGLHANNITTTYRDLAERR